MNASTLADDVEQLQLWPLTETGPARRGFIALLPAIAAADGSEFKNYAIQEA